MPELIRQLEDKDVYKRQVQIQRKENSDGLPVQLLSLRLSETVFPVEEAKHDTDS